MASESVEINCGPGFLTLLGLLFITLKLCGVVDWSWWLVLLPFYGGFVFFAIFFAIAAWLAAPPSRSFRRR